MLFHAYLTLRMLPYSPWPHIFINSTSSNISHLFNPCIKIGKSHFMHIRYRAKVCAILFGNAKYFLNNGFRKENITH